MPSNRVLFGIVILMVLGFALMPFINERPSEDSSNENIQKGKLEKEETLAGDKKLNEVAKNNEIVVTEVQTSKIELRPVEKKERKKEKLKAPEHATDLTKELYVNEKGESSSYHDKLIAVRKLGKKLSKDDKASLYEFLKYGPAGRSNLHVKDRILMVLDKQSNQDEHIDNLIEISNDRTVDGALRGYVVQHLRSAYLRTNIKNRNKLTEAFYKNLEDVDSDVSGTALLALTKLDKRFSGFNDSIIDEGSLNLASNENTYITSRVTAIQISGERKIYEVLPIARKELNRPNETVMKLASINAIGNVGNSDDLEVLEKILENKKAKVLHIAVKKAIKRIHKRKKV